MNRISLIRILVLSTIIAFSGLNAKPETLIRSEIPDNYKWDLTDVYKSWDEWELEFTELETKMDEYAAYKGRLSESSAILMETFKLGDDLGLLADRLYSFVAMSLHTDTRDNDVSAKLQRVQIMFSKFGTATAWFDPEMLTIPWETMEQWLDTEKGLAIYRHGIEDLYRQQAHVLDEQGEELLSYFSSFARTPRSIHSELSTSDIDFPEITLSNGDTITVTPGQYGQVLSTNRNQEDRETVFLARNGLYNETINTYAATYNGICQRDWAFAQSRKYNSTLEASLEGDNVPVDVYENLVKMVGEGTEPLKRYHRARKLLLELDEYHLYDSSIPVVDFDKTYEYDDVTEMVIASVAPLGKDYQNKLRTAFSGGWVDVYENEGKRGGAYSGGVYGVHPYMLLNYSDTIDDVFTLAHEMGHTIHTMYSNENQPFATTQYTLFVAEVSSTMAEALLLDYMLKKVKDPKEKITLLSHAINSIAGTFFTQVMFADFELQAHRLVEQGQPITAEVLNGIYAGLLDQYYGEDVYHDELYDITWARIPHFYFYPYYVYQYATCFASSAQLFKEINTGRKRDRKQAVKRYLELLKSGGNDYPMDQLKKAGVDLTQPATFQAVIDNFDELVTKLEEEIAKL